MKTDIHPKYGICEVSCVCGNTFTTRSVKPAIKVDICSACHPFYTGKQKLLDTAGRVEKFQKKFSVTGGKMVERKPKKAAKTTMAPKHLKKKVLSSAPKAVKGKETGKAAAPKAEKKAESK